MKVLGITGSSGSGKTTISKMFENFDGIFVINTDELVRSLDEKGSTYLKELKEYFGDDILLENGKLNRKLMSDIISKNDMARNELNRITKKNLLPKMLEEMQKNSNKEIIILDIPILFENKLEEYCDKVLVIISNRDEQIERICIRDSLTRENALRRLQTQQINEFYIKKADYVIYNINKTKENLKKEVEEIYKKILNKK